MLRRPPRSTRTDTLFPYTTLFRSGLRTHEAVLAAGDASHGATVHFVPEELDGGPLIIQGELSVYADDDSQTLAARVMDEIELKIYPQAVAWMARGEGSEERRVGKAGVSTCRSRGWA